MNKPKRGLGRGLGALIPGKTEPSPAPISEDSTPKAAEPNAAAGLSQIPVGLIHANPDQPRKTFDEAALSELAESIKDCGVLQPLLLRPDGEGYEIVAGERRYRAACLAGLSEVPALVRDFTPIEVTTIALIENVQREDLNAVEEARAYDRLMREFGLTQEQLAEKIGRSRSHISNILRLLKLPDRVQESLLEGVISMGQARPLLALEDAELMQKAADHIIDHDLSSRQAEKIVARMKKDPTLLSPKERLDEPVMTERVFVTDVEDRLRMMLGTRVRIALGEKKNRLEIEFYSQEDLDRIVEILTKNHEDEIEAKKRLLREVSWKFTT